MLPQPVTQYAKQMRENARAERLLVHKVRKDQVERNVQSGERRDEGDGGKVVCYHRQCRVDKDREAPSEDEDSVGYEAMAQMQYSAYRSSQLADPCTSHCKFVGGPGSARRTMLQDPHRRVGAVAQFYKIITSRREDGRKRATQGTVSPFVV
eukprot:SAG11_NODE_3532_length_2388_cov_2.694190_2_plen_152_part_00